VAGLRHNQAVVEAKVDKETITKWYGYLREVQEIIMSQRRQIGGVYEDENGEVVAHFVEVDESQIEIAFILLAVKTSQTISFPSCEADTKCLESVPHCMA